MIKQETLYKRDKTGKKVLVFEIRLEEVEPDDNYVLALTRTYAVKKKTGQLGGKMIEHTPDVIHHGKQSRTCLEQAELVFNSAINSKRDEGYKSLSDLGFDGSSVYEGIPTQIQMDSHMSLPLFLDKYLPTDRTDANGTLKPMKCTPLEKGAWKKVKYPAYGQPKLDGVRCFAERLETNFRFTSSSGKSYDCVCRFINEELMKLDIPIGTILDGELYIHGTPLQKISGWCRKQEPIIEHNEIQFHIFDVATKQPFKDRLDLLTTLDVYITINLTQFTKVNVVSTMKFFGEGDIKDMHDDFVADGYEGLIVRNADGQYAFGIRSSEIFKLKNFQDAEFEIDDAVLGKRGAADMVFVLKTDDGKPFEAKPLGTWEHKESMYKDLENIVGKMATVRFLTYSEDGIPTGNPVLKVIRDYE